MADELRTYKVTTVEYVEARSEQEALEASNGGFGNCRLEAFYAEEDDASAVEPTRDDTSTGSASMDVDEALARAIDATEELARLCEAGEGAQLDAERAAELGGAEQLRAASERLQRDVAVIDTEEPHAW